MPLFPTHAGRSHEALLQLDHPQRHGAVFLLNQVANAVGLRLGVHDHGQQPVVSLEDGKTEPSGVREKEADTCRDAVAMRRLCTGLPERTVA